MRNTLVLRGMCLVLAVILSACQDDQSKLQPLPAAQSTITVPQRSSHTFVAESGVPTELVLTVGDITHGQVRTSITSSQGLAILAPRSMQVGHSAAFGYGTSQFDLALMALENRLLGTDYARFSLTRLDRGALIASEKSRRDTEDAKIDALLLALRGLQGAQFLRNGESYTAAAAEKHLRRKWRAVGDKMLSAQDFIKHIATRSSSTGESYEIILPDGSRILAGEFLRVELGRIEAGTSD